MNFIKEWIKIIKQRLKWQKMKTIANKVLFLIKTKAVNLIVRVS
jgi:hypothetical protein